MSRRKLVALGAVAMSRAGMSPQGADAVNDRGQPREDPALVLVGDSGRVQAGLVLHGQPKRLDGLFRW